MDLVAQSILIYIDPNENIEENLEHALIELDRFITPELIELIVNGTAKKEAIENIREKFGLGREIQELRRYKADIEQFRQGRADAISESLARPGERERLVKELVEKAKSDYGLGLSKEKAQYLVRKMAEIGYSQDETIFRYVYVPHKVAQIYKDVYNKKATLTKKEGYMISALAEPIADRVIFKFSSRGEEIQKEWRAEKVHYLKWLLAEPGLSQGRKYYLEGRLSEAENWTSDVQLEDELGRLRKELELAVHIEKKFSEAGVAMDDGKARVMATHAYMSGLTEKDITDWTNRIISLKQLVWAAGIEAADELMDRIVYITDSWFELGLADEPEISVDSPTLKTAVEEQFKKLRDFLDLPKAKIDDVVTSMAAKGMQPVDIKLLVDKVLRMRKQIDNAIQREKNKSVFSDRTRAPRLWFDLCTSLSDRDLLVLLDSRNPDMNKKIGLAEIFGYSKAQVERLSRAINAMRNQIMTERLRGTVPKEVWQKSWSWFEKWRYNLYHRHSVNIGNLSLALIAALVVVVIHAIIKGVIFAKRKPWRMYWGPQQGPLTQEQRRERRTIWFRHFPYHEVVFLLISFATATLILVYDLSRFSWSALVLYAISFYWLVKIIIDLYAVKFLLRNILTSILPIKHALVPRINGPINPQLIPDDKSMVIINPLRPEGKDQPRKDEQLRMVIRKNVKLLEQIRSDNFISVLILQAHGNSTEMLSHYDDILMQELFNNPELSSRQDIKDRFYVLMMKGVAKPYNFHKFMRWLNKQPENEDPGNTLNWIFGVQTDDPLPNTHGMNPADVHRIRSSPNIDAGPNAIYGGYIRPGIIATVRGVENLRRLRGGDNPATRAILANGCIVDNDNSITSLTALRAINTMDDRYHIWQPTIVYYNAEDTLYAYAMKEFPQRALGDFANEGMQIVEDGIRSFGKYFFRMRLFYEAEVENNLFADMYPADSGWLKSEDEFHGFLGGSRACFVKDLIIYEHTPANFIDELAREEEKWLPTFDIPNSIFLHTPFRRILTNLGLSIFITIILSAAFGVGAFLSYYLLPTEMVLTVLLGGISIGSLIFVILLASIAAVATPEGINKIRNSSIPRIPPRGKYYAGLVIRGLFSELVWLVQLILTFYAMIKVGLLEVAFPFLGEIMFLSIMLLLIHPKFSQPLINRIGAIFNPREKPDGTRESRLVNIFKILLWPTVDVPKGVFEFVCSSTYLNKLILKLPSLVNGISRAFIDLRNQARGRKTPPTWTAYVESDKNPTIVEHLWKFRWPFAIGLSMLILTGAGIPALSNAMVVAKWALPILAILLGPVKFVWSYLIGRRTLQEKIHGDPENEEAYRRSFGNRVIIDVISSLALFGFLLSVGYFANVISGLIPVTLIIRASTIIVASFIFGPGVSWLVGVNMGRRIPGTVSPPQIKSILTKIFAVTLGWIIVGISLYFTFGPQIFKWAQPILGFMMPTADGAFGVFLPSWLSFGEALGLPWYFAIFFNTYVFGAAFLGTLGYIFGILNLIIVEGIIGRIRWIVGRGGIPGIGRGIRPKDHGPIINPAIRQMMEADRFVKVQRKGREFEFESTYGKGASREIFDSLPLAKAIGIAFDQYADDPEILRMLETTAHIFITPEDEDLARAPPFLWYEDANRYLIGHAGCGLDHTEQNSYLPYVLIYRLIDLLHQTTNHEEVNRIRFLIARIIRYLDRLAWEKRYGDPEWEDGAEVRKIIEEIEDYLGIPARSPAERPEARGSGGPARPGSMNVEFLAKIIEGMKSLVKVVGRGIRLFEKGRDVSRATEINITLQKMLIKLIEKGKIDLKEKTFEQLTKKDIRRLEVQVAELIMFHREVEDWEISELFDERVSGELFPLREAKENPEYLKVSGDYDYREWVKGIAWRTLREIYRVKGESLDVELVDTMTDDVINALEFRLANGKRISEMIANQMVRELAEHILGVLLEGDPEFVFYTYRKLKKVGRKVALAILEKEKYLDLLDELKRSIFAGLIGVEMKTPVTGTTKLVKTNAIQLDLEKPINQNVSTVKKQFAEMMKKDLAINFWREYEEEILESLRPVSMVFFTDDYIETIFDLKFIERQLEHNEYLTVHLVPRAHYYANDASYEDIMELMGEEVFKDLRRFYEEGRFTVCREGPHMSTFYKETISRQVAELLRQSDVVVGKGARAYETMQGIKKPGYFSMAVCREFTEAITGVDELSGAPVFIRHDPGVPSFTDFRYRADRAHIFEDGKVSGLARMTATDYARAVRSDAYSRLLEMFGDDRDKANRWIMKNTFRHGTTFAEEVFRGRLPIIYKEIPIIRAMSWSLIGGGVALLFVGAFTGELLTGAVLMSVGAGLRVVPWVYCFIKLLIPSRIAPEVEPELVRNAKEALLELATTLQPDSLKKIFGIENMTEMPAAAEDIEPKLTEEIEKPLRKFLRAFALLAKRPLSKEDQANIELTLEHIVADLTSLLQIYNAEYTKEPSRQVRLERLSELDVSIGKGGKPGARTRANLKLLREIYRNGDLFKWVITILLHDIGRFEEFYDPTATVHEKVSFDLITRFNVLKELNDSLNRPLSVEAISITPLIVRYHMFFRGPCEGGSSFIKIGQMLSDPYLQGVLSDEEGKIDKEKLKAFLDDLALFSVFDISGTKGKGRASNPRVEYFVGMVQEVGKIAEDAGYDWDKTVALAKQRASRYLNLRICGFLSFRDMNQKNISPPEPLGSFPGTECYKFYFKKFFESLNHLLRTDKLSKDWFTTWGRIRPWFVKNFTALTFRYLNYLVGHLAWIEEGVDFDRMSDEEIRKYFEREYKVKEDYKVNPNTIKLFLLLTRAARHENFGIQCEETIIGGENGERIDFKEDFHDYVIALNKILTQARDVNLYIDGNIYFVDEKQENIDGAVMVKETTADGTHRLILKISKEPEKITLPERPMTIEETIKAVNAKLKEKGWKVPESSVREILTTHTHPKPKVVPNEKRIERLAEQVWIIYLMLKYFKKTLKKERPASLVSVQNVYKKEGEEISRGGPEDFTEIKIVTKDRVGLFGDAANKIAEFGGFIKSDWSYTEEINGERLIVLVFEIHKPFDPDKPTEGGRFDVDFVVEQYEFDENTRVLTTRRDAKGKPILIPRFPEKEPEGLWWKWFADKVRLDRKDSIIKAVIRGSEKDKYMPEGIYGYFLKKILKIIITRHLASHMEAEEEPKGFNMGYTLKRLEMQCLYAFVSLLISFQANRDRKDKLVYFLLYTPFMNLLSQLKEKGITRTIMDHNEIIVIVPNHSRIINAKIDAEIRKVIGKYNGIAVEPWIAPVSLPENIAGKDRQRNFVIRGYEIIRQSEELPEGTPKGTRRLVGKEIDELRQALSEVKVDNLSMRSVTRKKIEKLLEKRKRGKRSSTRLWSLLFGGLIISLFIYSVVNASVGEYIGSGRGDGTFALLVPLGILGGLIFAITVVGARAIYQQVGIAGTGLVEVEQVRLSKALGLEAVWQALVSLFEGGQRIVAAIGQRAQESAKHRWGWVLPQKRPTEREITRLMEFAEELRGVMPQLRTQEISYPENPEIISQMLVWRPEEMAGKVEEIEELAEMVRRAYERGEITEVVVIEEAGEHARVGPIITGKLRGYPAIRVLKANRPEAVWEIERKIDLEKTLFVTSSLGPGYQYFYRKLIRLLESKGIPAKEIAFQVGKHFVGIGGPNTPIAREAKKSKFLKLFNVPEGRSAPYSVFSYQGLVPLASAGVNIKSFVESGKMAEAMCREKDLRKNPGVKLTLLLEERRQPGKQIILVLPEQLKGFGEAWQGLISNLGGEGKQIISVTEKELASPESYEENTAFIRVRTEVAKESLAIKQLREAGYSVHEISLPGEEPMGGLFYLGEFVTRLSYLMGIGPFRKPGGVATSIGLAEKMAGAKGLGSSAIKIAELLSDYEVNRELVKRVKTPQVYLFHLETLLDIEFVKEPSPSGMDIELRVKPNSLAVFALINDIVRAAQEVGNLDKVKFVFVSSNKLLKREVMAKMLRDHMSACGISPAVVASVIDEGLIIDGEMRGVVDISGKISTRAVCSIINRWLFGPPDANMADIKIITHRESEWRKNVDRETLEKLLWVVLEEPATEGEILSTAAGLAVAIEGKDSKCLRELLEERYPRDVERLLSEITRNGKIILPPIQVHKDYLRRIKEERAYRIQA